MEKKNVAVIGAGPMGLSAAYYLGRSGKFRCTVFESAKSMGGMSASFDFDGVRIEKYYHFINTPDQVLFGMLREIGLYDTLRWTPTKMGLFRWNEKLGHGVLHPWGTPKALLQLNEIPLITRFRYGFHAFCCKFLKDLGPLDQEAASAWFEKWEGKKGYEVFWKFLFEKKFFELADPLSAAWIASRIRRVANSRKSLAQEEYGYLEGGSESLVNALAAKIKEQGGEIRLSDGAKKITPLPEGGAEVETVSGKGRYDLVISTIPLPYLPKIAPELPADYLSRVSQVQNIGCACALYRLQKPLTENFWLNTDMPEWDIPGIIEYSNLRQNMGKSYVYIPFYMPKTHPNWKASDEELLEKGRKCLAEVNPEAAATEERAVMFRYDYAQPVCQPGFMKILPRYFTGAKGIWAADTAHSFPEDRSLNESIRIAGEIASEIEAQF